VFPHIGVFIALLRPQGEGEVLLFARVEDEGELFPNDLLLLPVQGVSEGPRSLPPRFLKEGDRGEGDAERKGWSGGLRRRLWFGL